MGECLTWKDIGWLVGVIAGWSLVIIATARWAISTGFKGIKENIALSFQGVDNKISAQNEKIQEQDQKVEKVVEKNHEIELNVCKLQADIPLFYVRREDFIREEVTINTKLDRLRDMIARKSKEQGDDTGS